jgi:HlyD family secretion protein
MDKNEVQNARPAAKQTTGLLRGRRWLPYFGALLVAALIAAGLWPEATPVETARVNAGPLRTTINEEGKTRIKNRYMVSAPVSGQLRRIQLKAGDAVEAGRTVIAVVDPISPAMLDARVKASAEARRDTAVANLEKARAAHAFSANDLKRFEKLVALKMIAQQEFESAQLREASAAKEQAAAESALRQAEAELAEFTPSAHSPSSRSRALTEVKAPVSGRVLRVVEESTRVVAMGAPLVEIGDPAEIEAVIDVLSRDGAAIAPGAPVELEQWGSGEPLAARVRFVEPAAFTKVSALGVEEQRVNVVADILAPVEKRQSLGDNFRVEARIITWQSNRALKVPSGALFRSGAGWAAFVVRDGRARLQSVSAGRSSGPETQVLDGIKENDEVIVYPGDRVHDGERVKPIKVSAQS